MAEPQTANTGSSSGVPSTLGQALETPQAAPAVGQPPDTSTLPPTQGGGQEPTDWQVAFQEERERRQGVDRRLAQEQVARQQLASQLAQLQEQVTRMTSSPAPEPQQAPQTDVLQQAIQRRQAEQYRDLLIQQYEQQLGVPLSLFRDHIPAVPPVLGADGAIDDAAQRTAIQGFATNLQQVQGQVAQRTQQTVLQGMTPGSAPGAPAPTTAADTYNEFLEVMEAYGSEAFGTLPRPDQQRIEARYFELLEDPVVTQQHGGQTRPTMSWDEMQQTMRELVRRVNSQGPAMQRPPGVM